jgi:hypothetical protein
VGKVRRPGLRMRPSKRA